MKPFDITLPIHNGMLSWPSDPDVELYPAKTLAKNGSNLLAWKSGTHLGTHFDAPKHVLDNGEGIDRLDLERCIGPAVVCDLTAVAEVEITVADLEGAVPDSAERVLLKTPNTTRHLLTQPYTEDYTALGGDAAAWLAQRGTKLVGIDYLSIQRRGSDGRAHTELLSKGIPIIEGLWLEDVPAGEYHLIALPLLIEDGDGAPARVLLQAR
jgi:arylformamidase